MKILEGTDQEPKELIYAVELTWSGEEPKSFKKYLNDNPDKLKERKTSTIANIPFYKKTIEEQ